MEEKVIKTIGLGVLSWTITFLTSRRIFSNYSFDFSKRLVSTIHALLAVTLASLSVQDWNCPLCPVPPSSSHPQCVSEMVMAVWLGEMSSPFLHMREFPKEMGYRDTACNLAADILFAATYTVARFVFGAYLAAYVILSADNRPNIKVVGLGLEIVNAIWLLKIVRIVK